MAEDAKTALAKKIMESSLGGGVSIEDSVEAHQNLEKLNGEE